MEWWEERKISTWYINCSDRKWWIIKYGCPGDEIVSWKVTYPRHDSKNRDIRVSATCPFEWSAYCVSSQSECLSFEGQLQSLERRKNRTKDRKPRERSKTYRLR